MHGVAVPPLLTGSVPLTETLSYPHYRLFMMAVCVLLAIGLPHEVAHGSLRLSVGEYNTDEEMAYIVDNVRQVVAYLRSISPVWYELETGARPHLI